MKTPEKHNVAAAPTASDTTQTPGPPAKGILCAKCEHVNVAGSTTCKRCRSHLHIKCNDCGTTNERVYTTCRHCGRRLHKSALGKAGARLFKGASKVKPLHVVIFIAVVGVMFYAIVALTRLRLPN